MYLPFNILVIDDEPAMRDSCFQILSRNGCNVTLSENGKQGLAYMKKQNYDVVILDLKIPDMDGFEVLKSINVNNHDCAVIIVTGFSTVENAVETMKLGAHDFVPKPFTPNQLRTVVARALEKKRFFKESQSGGNCNPILKGNDNIIGVSPVVTELKEFIKRAGMSDCSVLITGDTGTGKELVARALHYFSLRRNENFVTVDSGGLVDTLIESELFGHNKGSFTGAVSNRIGRFELAHKGTLFFDEISNMSYRIQSKLLRALQEKKISRVGSSTQIPVDVRILAATNLLLKNEIQNGKFREDLFYRLNVIPIYMPPLRERREDIPVLAEHFLERFRKMKNSDYPEMISDKAMQSMINYNWPGNVRELEHLIKRAVALCEEKEVNPFEIFKGISCVTPEFFSDNQQLEQLNEVEKKHIELMLEKFQYNKSRTANALGIDRKTLRSKIRKYGLYENEMSIE
ncbi:sigma-54-dependent transcriptional regulator [Candidatus Latescibacterota bacterium]